RESLCLCSKVNFKEVENMPEWGKTATWLMLVTAIVVFLAAVFVVGSTIGRLFILGAIELSIPQIGIICAGVTSVSVFVRCVKKLEGRVKNVGV
ncbi:hypothetical protein C7Y69_12170, partial [Alteromonas sp. KS69]